MFNHDLQQIYIGASDASIDTLTVHCDQTCSRMKNWERPRHRIDWVEAVEEFATQRQAWAYARWLFREGAFEGTEDFTIGMDAALH